MGDKITAKTTAQELGIPVVPGSDGEVKTEEGSAGPAEIGYPVLIKATAGGSGRGMKVAKSPDDLIEAWSTARTEAAAARQRSRLYERKYLGKRRRNPGVR